MMFEKDINFDITKAIKKTNNQILKEESELVRKYNLTPSQYGVLECLYIKGDKCINELIKSQISTSGTMTVIVKNLEKMQYVKKEIDTLDKRAFKVALTAKGKYIVESILPERQNKLKDFADTLTDTEKEELLRILYKFKSRYKESN